MKWVTDRLPQAYFPKVIVCLGPEKHAWWNPTLMIWEHYGLDLNGKWGTTEVHDVMAWLDSDSFDNQNGLIKTDWKAIQVNNKVKG